MNVINIVEYDEIRAGIEKVKDACNFIPDTSTKEGYEKSKRVALDHGKLLTSLEKIRKERKSYWLEGGKQVDAQAKAIASEIEAAIAPHKEAYKKLDNERKEREAARVAKLESRVECLRNLPDDMRDSSSDEILAAMNALNDEECLDFYEFTKVALEARNSSKERLAQLYTQVKNREDERAELDLLRKQAEERAIFEREEQIKREAIAKAEQEKQQAIEAQRAAELAKFEAEKRALEQEKLAAKQAEEAAERARLDEIARQEAEALRIKQEEEAREANKKHVGNIRKKAKEALMHVGADEEIAKKIVLAINAGEIPNVSIKY